MNCGWFIPKGPHSESFLVKLSVPSIKVMCNYKLLVTHTSCLNTSYRICLSFTSKNTDPPTTLRYGYSTTRKRTLPTHHIVDLWSVTKTTKSFQDYTYLNRSSFKDLWIDLVLNGSLLSSTKDQRIFLDIVTRRPPSGHDKYPSKTCDWISVKLISRQSNKTIFPYRRSPISSRPLNRGFNMVVHTTLLSFKTFE